MPLESAVNNYNNRRRDLQHCYGNFDYCVVGSCALESNYGADSENKIAPSTLGIFHSAARKLERSGQSSPKHSFILPLEIQIEAKAMNFGIQMADRRSSPLFRN